MENKRKRKRDKGAPRSASLSIRTGSSAGSDFKAVQRTTCGSGGVVTSARTVTGALTQGSLVWSVSACNAWGCRVGTTSETYGLLTVVWWFWGVPRETLREKHRRDVSAAPPAWGKSDTGLAPVLHDVRAGTGHARGGRVEVTRPPDVLGVAGLGLVPLWLIRDGHVQLDRLQQLAGCGVVRDHCLHEAGQLRLRAPRHHNSLAVDVLQQNAPKAFVVPRSPRAPAQKRLFDGVGRLLNALVLRGLVAGSVLPFVLGGATAAAASSHPDRWRQPSPSPTTA